MTQLSRARAAEGFCPFFDYCVCGSGPIHAINDKSWVYCARLDLYWGVHAGNLEVILAEVAQTSEVRT